MPRGKPAPKILADHGTRQVIEAPALYVVTYHQRTFGVRASKATNKHMGGSAYIRTCFPSELAARNLANKLNKEFSTNAFEYRKIEF